MEERHPSVLRGFSACRTLFSFSQELDVADLFLLLSGYRIFIIFPLRTIRVFRKIGLPLLEHHYCGF